MNIIETIEREWLVISSTPWTFAIVIVSIIALAWKAFGYLNNTKVETLKAQLDFANSTVAEFKKKTEVNSPDDAQEKIRSLEKEVQEIKESVQKLGPKRISAQQKQSIISALSIAAGARVSIAKDGASSEAQTLSSDLVDAFKRGGWRVDTPMVLGLGNPPPTGIEIRLSQAQARSVSEQAIINAFEAAAIRYNITYGKLGMREEDGIVAEITLTTSTIIDS